MLSVIAVIFNEVDVPTFPMRDVNFGFFRVNGSGWYLE